jgi:hypothetical protein
MERDSACIPDPDPARNLLAMMRFSGTTSLLHRSIGKEFDVTVMGV